MITLTAVPDVNGTWQVSQDGAVLGTWQRTDTGARFSDMAGECVTVVSAAGDGTAIVAGIGAQRGRWSDIAHKILAGSAGVVIDGQHCYPASVPDYCPGCGGEDMHLPGCSFIEHNGAN